MFYVIQQNGTNNILGFLFLYLDDENPSEIRLGYLLSEQTWGQGFGSEIIAGLVAWAKNNKDISSIAGGVEADNIGSIRVLEKSGFKNSDEKLPGNMLLYQINVNV